MWSWLRALREPEAEYKYQFYYIRGAEAYGEAKDSASRPPDESVAIRAPGVAEVAVVARPDDDYGEVPVAFVVARKDADAADVEAAVLARCREHLAKFKVPREVRILHELPMVGFGKVSKAKLREMLQE